MPIGRPVCSYRINTLQIDSDILHAVAISRRRVGNPLTEAGTARQQEARAVEKKYEWSLLEIG